MGTNASNRKVASKVLAILLAALMLLTAMPMAASAISSLASSIVIEGMGLAEWPEVTEYEEGDKLILSDTVVTGDGEEDLIRGFRLSVTYIQKSEIAAVGADNCTRYTETLEYKDLVTYGITCNFTDGQVLTLADNTKPLTFKYGVNNAETYVSNCFFAVFPKDFYYGQRVTSFNGTWFQGDEDFGDFVITADNVMLSNLTLKNVIIGTQGIESVVRTLPVTREGSIIANITADVKNISISGDDDVLWNIQNLDRDENGYYTLQWATADEDDNNDLLHAQALDSDVYDGAWPVTTEGAETDFSMWTLTKCEDGKMFIVAEIEYIVKENGVNVTKYAEKNLYLAVENGYAYLTNDETKAAKINIFEKLVTDVIDIEIAKNPDKMTYVEGERFDASGMLVNLIYDNNKVVCVPAELFGVYGIDIWPNYNFYAAPDMFGVAYTGDVLTVKGHNDKAIWVDYYGYDDDSDVKLKVIDDGDAVYEIPADGKLVNGNYVIAWIPEMGQTMTSKGQMFPNDVYYGSAISSVSATIEKGGDATYSISSLSGKMIESLNNRLGQYQDYFVANNTITKDMVWTVNKTIDGYTFKSFDTGKYLNRKSISYAELFAIDMFPSDVINPNDVPVAQGFATLGRVLVLGDLSDDSYWLVDGAINAAIQSEATTLVDNYYIISGLGFFAAASLDSFAAPVSISDNFYFFKTTVNNIKAIAVVDQPNLAYNAGEALDLDDLVVKITYDNGETKDVPFDDFGSFGLSTSVANGTALSVSANNGKTITISIGSVSAQTGALTVTDSNTGVKVIRMGGVDRYETAAIIGNNFGFASKTIVLANSEKFPDALAGSPLAYALKAPILLSKVNSLNSFTSNAIKANGINTVYILGGTSAISANIEAQLKALGVTSIKRIAGADRVETSIAIAKELATLKGASSEIIFTNASNYPDALSVSSAAAKTGTPIIYVDGALTSSVSTFATNSKATKATVLGGISAISDSVFSSISGLGMTVTRVGGDTRYETSALIAQYYASLFNGKNVTIATGRDFPDALAGGVFAANVDASVILVDNGYTNAAAAAYIAGLKLETLYVFGGTAAVNDATVNAVLYK